MSSNGVIRWEPWGRIAVALLPFVIAGVVAFITMRADVRHLEQAVAAKANRDVVEAQYQAIIKSLDELKADVRAIRNGR